MFTQVGNSEVSAFPFAAAGRFQRGSAASFRAASPLNVSSANGPLQWEGARPPGSLSHEALPVVDKSMWTFTIATFSHFLFASLSVFPNSPVLVLMKLLKLTAPSCYVYVSKHTFPPFFFLSLSCIACFSFTSRGLAFCFSIWLSHVASYVRTAEHTHCQGD